MKCFTPYEHEEWKRRLGLKPTDFLKKTFEPYHEKIEISDDGRSINVEFFPFKWLRVAIEFRGAIERLPSLVKIALIPLPRIFAMTMFEHFFHDPRFCAVRSASLALPIEFSLEKKPYYGQHFNDPAESMIKIYVNSFKSGRIATTKAYEIVDTILHEVAHALHVYITPKKDAHGRDFKIIYHSLARNWEHFLSERLAEFIALSKKQRVEVMR